MAEEADKARARLVELQGDLRKHNFLYAADAIQNYLDRKVESLDEAFGLKSPIRRGRPVVREARHLEIARAMLAFRLKAEAGERGAIGEFEEELAKKYNLSDGRAVRKIYADNESAVLAEELAMRLAKDDGATG